MFVIIVLFHSPTLQTVKIYLLLRNAEEGSSAKSLCNNGLINLHIVIFGNALLDRMYAIASKRPIY